MNRAVYSWGRAYGVVWIIDKCEPGAASITNDIERVLADLRQLGVAPDAQPIVYQDSLGRWDRIATRSGDFADFSPLGAASLIDAVRAMEGLPFLPWKDAP